MLIKFNTLLAAFSLSRVAALPSPVLEIRASTYTDPPYSVSTAQLAASLTCPRGVEGKAGGVVLLVHGTGSTGPETWEKGPYNTILPTYGAGYDICWVTLPGKSLGNAATSAEYVVYNIKALASQSSTGKVFAIGHSQGGGLNIPWPLDFFPSTQPLVSGFVALSGDFRGTSLGGAACFGLDTLEGACSESIWQQAQNSSYLRAQYVGSSHAIVGTTSIFTFDDEIIPPEPYDSTLSGASNILIQSVDACGPLKLVDHFLAPFDSGYFGIALDAITHGGVASISRFDKSYCDGYPNGTLATDVKTLANTLSSGVHDALNMITAMSPYVSKAEPPLPEYVCTRYPEAQYHLDLTCASGFLPK